MPHSDPMLPLRERPEERHMRELQAEGHNPRRPGADRSQAADRSREERQDSQAVDSQPERRGNRGADSPVADTLGLARRASARARRS